MLHLKCLLTVFYQPYLISCQGGWGFISRPIWQDRICKEGKRAKKKNLCISAEFFAMKKVCDVNSYVLYTWNMKKYYQKDGFNHFFMPIVPAPAQCHHGVTVEHWRYEGNNGDNTLHINSVSPAMSPLVKGHIASSALSLRVGERSEAENEVWVPLHQ